MKNCGRVSMLTSLRPEVFCVEITDDLIEPVIDCLQRGFPERPRDYWAKALERLSKRAMIGDYPRYGYALAAEDRIVGVILLIFSHCDGESDGDIRCNLSSWCVDKEFRNYAPLLHFTAVKRKEATYLNISPAEHTRKTIEAFGFRRFSNGQMILAPILSSPQRDAKVIPFAPDGPEASLLPPNERRLLAEHAAMGCVSLICVKDGGAHPFVFQRRAIFHRLISCPQLIYCRSMDEFLRFAGPIGRFLLFRTGPICAADAMASLTGFVGRYFPERAPKYFKGPRPPRLGDLSYTELVIPGP
jgi:hypothetical protein